MVLIYVQNVTPRVLYSFKQICKRILGLEIDFTSKIEPFIAHVGPKLSYGKQPLGKELYFQSVNLLFEHGLNEVDIQVQDWEDTICFFRVKNEQSALPFDIFAATFYLLTRYEEYLPHVKDEMGRFMATESLAYAHNFLQDPVVDIWAYKLKTILLDKYPDLAFENNGFSIIPIVKVSRTFIYKQKGVLRSLGGGIRDLWQLEFNRVADRAKVLLSLRKDPYDIFDFIVKLQQKKKRKAIVLFGLGDLSKYEKNISYTDPEHQKIIKHVADYIPVGLKVSYDGISDLMTLKKEKQRMEGIINRHLRHMICAFYKIQIPTAYRNFIELEIEEDFSMGYRDYLGFRAGTCTPFLFYDLDYEVQTPLLIHSFCFTNRGFKNIKDPGLAKQEVISYMEKIKKVNGTFIPIFSSALFSELNGQTYWRSILEYIWDIEENTGNP